MSNIKVFFKNFTAGRKALFKRMVIYLGSYSLRTVLWHNGAKVSLSAVSA